MSVIPQATKRTRKAPRPRPVQSLDYAQTVTKCEHSVPDIMALVAEIRRRDRMTIVAGAIKAVRLGAGVSKVAYAICAQHVVKVDLERSYKQGLKELRFWQAADAKARKILAPIFAADADGTVLVVGRCSTDDVKWHWPSSPPVKYQRLIDKAEDIGISDLHSGNVGNYKGRAVVLDYGLNDVSVSNSDEYPFSPSPVEQSPFVPLRCSVCDRTIGCCRIHHSCPKPTPIPPVPFVAVIPWTCGIAACILCYRRK